MSTVIKAKVSKLLDRAEDPAETLDYGYQKQVDDYFEAHPGPVYLHRVDNTARLVVKQDGA